MLDEINKLKLRILLLEAVCFFFKQTSHVKIKPARSDGTPLRSVLPNEIIEMILNQLSGVDLRQASLVSNAWREVSHLIIDQRLYTPTNYVFRRITRSSKKCRRPIQTLLVDSKDTDRS